MNKLVTTGIVLMGLFQAASSFALVRGIANCQTSDGKYTLFIGDNQGIGPVRKSNFYAIIKDANDETVGSYSLNYIPSNGSVSFGHASYEDTATQGQEFFFAYRSTNTPYALTATLKNGEKIAYGLKFQPEQSQGDLSCQVF